jgi:hypothetical protein
VLDTEKNYWFKAPVTGVLPPRLRHFELQVIGRQLHVVGGWLEETPTPAFRGAGLQYEAGSDYLYSLNTDRCEWTQRHCHGVIPKYPTKATVTATETDLWQIHPTVGPRAGPPPPPPPPGARGGGPTKKTAPLGRPGVRAR